MKNIISLFIVIASIYNCKAQQVYPLNTFYEDAPNYAYMKDLNNDLPQYVGIYKATFEGNEITLFITQEDYVLQNRPQNRKFYRDVLHVKYIVKKISTGAILQDTQNFASVGNINKLISMGTNPLSDNNSLSISYSGTNCEVGWGRVTFKKINANQISWSYYPNSTMLTQETCPGNPDIKVYLPDTKDLIFTKQ